MVMNVVEALARETGIDNLGVLAARGLPLGALGFVDYSASASATLSQALDRVARYSALAFDGVAFEIVIDGDVARIVQRYLEIPHRRHAVEFTTAMVASRCRALVGPDMSFRAASFAHDAPRHTTEHVSVFGVEPSFGASIDELVIDSALLAHPLLTADRAVSELLEEHGRRLAGKIASRDPLLDRVRTCIAQDLPNGAPSLGAVASAIKMAPRTLQRKLNERGTSCSEVVDRLRCEIATQLVSAAEPPLNIAFRLGFKDATAFYRAFKRWTGTTPREFREKSHA